MAVSVDGGRVEWVAPAPNTRATRGGGGGGAAVRERDKTECAHAMRGKATHQTQQNQRNHAPATVATPLGHDGRRHCHVFYSPSPESITLTLKT